MSLLQEGRSCRRFQDTVPGREELFTQTGAWQRPNGGIHAVDTRVFLTLLTGRTELRWEPVPDGGSARLVSNGTN